MLDATGGTSTVADDGTTDPNLQLLTQAKAAATPTADTAPIPTPPPLPAAPAPTAPSPTSTTASDANAGAIPAPPPLATAPAAPAASGDVTNPFTGNTIGTAPTAPSPTGAPAAPAQTTTFSGGGTAFTGTYDPAVDAAGGYIVANAAQGTQLDAAKSAYQQQQLQASGATNIQYNPFTRQYVDADKTPIYNAAGTGPAGGESAADVAANAARAQSIINDPTATAAAKALAALPGYGTAAFDQSLNNGSNPALAQQVQQLLSTSASQHVAAPAPGAPDYLVNGQHYATMADAIKAQLSGGTAPGAGGASMSLTPPAHATDGTPSAGLGTAMPVAPAGSSTTSGPFTPANVAIGSSILPNADPRLANIQSLLDSSASSLSGVDRTKLAQSMFDNFATSSAPQYQLALRQATQSAAGAGRIGSGMLRTSYGDLANQRDQQLQSAQTGFMNDALNGSIQDTLNKFNALSGLDTQTYNQSADTNNQLRTERGYQGSLEQQAFDRALQQYQTQQQAQQQQFENGVTLTNVGNAGNPAEMYTQLAAQMGIDPSVLMALASGMGASPTTPTPAPVVPPVPGGYVDDTRIPNTATT